MDERHEIERDIRLIRQGINTLANWSRHSINDQAVSREVSRLFSILARLEPQPAPSEGETGSGEGEG